MLAWLLRLARKADPRQRLARAGEDLAARHLEEKGYRILGRRLRTRFAEIDLLAETGPLVVVVEVKTRRTDRHGAPAEAVDRIKAERLRRAAVSLLSRDRKLSDRPCRIDVVEVIWPAGAPAAVRHLEDAVDRGRF